MPTFQLFKRSNWNKKIYGKHTEFMGALTFAWLFAYWFAFLGEFCRFFILYHWHFVRIGCRRRALAGGFWRTKIQRKCFFCARSRYCGAVYVEIFSEINTERNFYGKLNELVYLDMVFGFLYGRIIRMLKKSINIALNNMTVECINHWMIEYMNLLL